MRGRRIIGTKRQFIQAYATHCSVLALAILILTVTLTPAPAQSEEFPVWWSPTLGLESLDDIDAILDEPYAPEDVWEVIRIRIIDNKVEQSESVVTNCRSHIELVKDGFGVMVPKGEFQNLGSRCFALDALAGAKLTTISHFQNFSLGLDVLSIFPPMPRPNSKCSYLADVSDANRDGIAWNDYRENDFGSYFCRNRYPTRKWNRDCGGS